MNKSTKESSRIAEQINSETAETIRDFCSYFQSSEYVDFLNDMFGEYISSIDASDFQDEVEKLQELLKDKSHMLRHIIDIILRLYEIHNTTIRHKLNESKA